MHSILSALTWSPMQPAARSRLYSKDSAGAGVFAKSAVIGVVKVRNSLCRVFYASFFCQPEAIFFH